MFLFLYIFQRSKDYVSLTFVSLILNLKTNQPKPYSNPSSCPSWGFKSGERAIEAEPPCGSSPDGRDQENPKWGGGCVCVYVTERNTTISIHWTNNIIIISLLLLLPATTISSALALCQLLYGYSQGSHTTILWYRNYYYPCFKRRKQKLREVKQLVQGLTVN